MFFPSTFRALRSRNYRIYMGGQSLSLIGTWMQQVAIGWLVYRLSESPFWLGVVGFSAQIPILFFTPIAGVTADRFSRRTILLVTQTLFMIQALLLAVMVFSHQETLALIIALSLFHGIVMAFDAPARHAFVVEMVAFSEDVSNAIALNSALFHASRFIGPSVAGLIIMGWGEGVCFFLNGISYLATIAALLAMRISVSPRGIIEGTVFRQFLDGLRYARNSFPIKSILSLVAFVCFVGMPYTTLLPVVARDVLGGDSASYGYLMSAAGVGAVCGALYLASRRKGADLLRNITIAPLVFGAGILVLAFSRNVVLSLLVLAVAAFGMMTVMATANTLLQEVVEEHVRGRTMSFYSLAFFGSVPFGNLIAGALANHIGVPFTLVIAASLSVGATIVFGTQCYRRISLEMVSKMNGG